jgi:beta-lactamase superfamily II metal-dependent hydrolase
VTFSIELLPAGYGDSLVVEYGKKNDRHQLLIDAGPHFFWETVQAGLMRRTNDRYELFVITHVDEDHIGGAISLLDDPNLKHRVDHIWFNGYVHCSEGGNVLGPVNGEQLTSRIVNGGFRWNKGFRWPPGADRFGSDDVGGPVVVPGTGDLPAVDLPGGARAVLLSPTGTKLAAMERVWKRAVRKAGLVEGLGDTGHTASPAPHERERPQLPDPLDRAAITRLAAVDARDGSAANGSCIAFILEYDDKRLLLGADAHAGVLGDGLKRYAMQVGEKRVRLDLVKLAHHGSNANISTRMLELIDCDRWLISTNGLNYGHPDDSAIAKVITSSARPVTFYCNYATGRTHPWELKGPGVGAAFEFPDRRKRMVVNV